MVHEFLKMNRTLVFVGFLTVLNLANVFGSDPKLRLVNVVFRHGDRTPNFYESYPNDPYANYTYFPIGRGGLTNGGKQREYHLGKVLKSRYGHFLGDVYYPAVLEARSSNVDRTKMSLQLVLSALYPPAPVQTWNKDLPWQPIPTVYDPMTEDLLFASQFCPQYIAEFASVMSSSEVLAKTAELQDVLDSIGKLSGIESPSIADLYGLYQTFDAQASSNLTLPDWVYEFYPDGELLRGATLYYEITSYNDELKRKSGGTLLSRIVDSAVGLRNGTLDEGRKLFLYSGHEINVASLQLTLGVYEPHVPAYSSAVIIELWERDDEYLIKVLFHTGIPSKIVTQTIPGCTELCPLDKFIELLKPVTATADDLKCGKEGNTHS